MGQGSALQARLNHSINNASGLKVVRMRAVCCKKKCLGIKCS